MKSYRDYFYPGTYTLQNKLSIKDPKSLEIAERALTTARLFDPVGPIELSAEGLKRVHHHLFQDVYPWAGQFRTVDMVKVVENGPNISFAPATHIARLEIPRFFQELNYDLNVNKAFDRLDPRTFSFRAAVYIADLNNIHPFPDGNGRTQRLLLGEIAKRAGYQLDQTKLDRDAWIGGAIDSRGQDQGRSFGQHSVMTKVIEQAVSPVQQLKAGKPEPGDVVDRPLSADAQAPAVAIHQKAFDSAKADLSPDGRIMLSALSETIDRQMAKQPSEAKAALKAYVAAELVRKEHAEGPVVLSTEHKRAAAAPEPAREVLLTDAIKPPRVKPDAPRRPPGR